MFLFLLYFLILLFSHSLSLTFFLICSRSRRPRSS
jgi:hypothetical protein